MSELISAPTIPISLDTLVPDLLHLTLMQVVSVEQPKRLQWNCILVLNPNRMVEQRGETPSLALAHALDEALKLAGH